VQYGTEHNPSTIWFESLEGNVSCMLKTKMTWLDYEGEKAASYRGRLGTRQPGGGVSNRGSPLPYPPSNHNFTFCVDCHMWRSRRVCESLSLWLTVHC